MDIRLESIDTAISNVSTYGFEWINSKFCDSLGPVGQFPIQHKATCYMYKAGFFIALSIDSSVSTGLHLVGVGKY